MSGYGAIFALRFVRDSDDEAVESEELLPLEGATRAAHRLLDEFAARAHPGVTVQIVNREEGITVDEYYTSFGEITSNFPI